MLHLHFCSSIHEFFFNAKSLDICFTFPHFYCTMLWNCEKCINIFSLTKNYDPSSSNSDHRISIIDNCIHYKLMNQVNRLSVHHAFNQFLLFKMLIKLEIYYPSILPNDHCANYFALFWCSLEFVNFQFNERIEFSFAMQIFGIRHLIHSFILLAPFHQ